MLDNLVNRAAVDQSHAATRTAVDEAVVEARQLPDDYGWQDAFALLVTSIKAGHRDRGRLLAAEALLRLAAAAPRP